VATHTAGRMAFAGAGACGNAHGELDDVVGADAVAATSGGGSRISRGPLRCPAEMGSRLRRASRLRALGVLASAGLACAGAGEPAPAAAPPPAATLRVGTSGDYPPFSLRTGADEAPFAGFDVELAERIAADLGLALEWVPFRWPELEARIAADEMDVAMSGVTWRPWRAATGWMTRAVAVGGPCVAGDPTPKRVAVNRGGVLERFARRRFPDAEIRPLDDNRALGAALGPGGADAVVTDSF